MREVSLQVFWQQALVWPNYDDVLVDTRREDIDRNNAAASNGVSVACDVEKYVPWLDCHTGQCLCSVVSDKN
jgi:hypothetical protein